MGHSLFTEGCTPKTLSVGMAVGQIAIGRIDVLVPHDFNYSRLQPWRAGRVSFQPCTCRKAPAREARRCSGR